MCLGRFDQVLDFLDNPHEAYNLQLSWLVILFDGGKKLKEEEDKRY